MESVSLDTLVFDQFSGAPAGVEMKKTFISVLRLQAQLAREAASSDIRGSGERSDALRETISTRFDKVRALADGVLFEFGPSRPQDLALRDRSPSGCPRVRTMSDRLPCWRIWRTDSRVNRRREARSFATLSGPWRRQSRPLMGSRENSV